jgi:ATP-dependent RNA helicase DeaD
MAAAHGASGLFPDLKPSFSRGELLADMSQQTMSALATARISGIVIDLKPDKGGRPPRPQRPTRTTAARPHAGKKPRHKDR